MAVGEFVVPDLKPVAGFELGVVEAGIKKVDRRDLVVMCWPESASVAATFTQNRFCAAPVQLAKRNLGAKPVAAVINTGYANAGTGPKGLEDAEAVCARLAELLHVRAEQILPFSTGVIGEPLPVARINAGLPQAVTALEVAGWYNAAHGIMTTDTRPKAASVQFEHEGQTFTLTGISKGAGMIQPNMATMLGFMATDLAVEQALLQQLLLRAVNGSFNRISVDGDTSTNDSCLLVATGSAGNTPLSTLESALGQKFLSALESLSLTLAQAIVRDGEGATKFVTIEVGQAANAEEALKVAFAIAHSPLVKTALFASDPNWGRILAVVGRAGIDDLAVERVNIWLDDVQIVADGGAAPGYSEAQGSAVMAQEEILIRIALGRGEVQETVWTTDLSHDYVTINAEYRT